MNCPRCARELKQVMVSLCRAHTCAACGGVWVPFESCEAVMPRLTELAPEEPPAEAPDRKGTGLNSSHGKLFRMPSPA